MLLLGTPFVENPSNMVDRLSYLSDQSPIGNLYHSRGGNGQWSGKAKSITVSTGAAESIELTLA